MKNVILKTLLAVSIACGTFSAPITVYGQAIETESVLSDNEAALESYVLLPGPRFNKKIPSSAKEIEFSSAPAPTGTKLTDLSEIRDGSVVGWMEDNKFIISTQNVDEKVRFNVDSSRMFGESNAYRNPTQFQGSKITFYNIDTSNVENMSEMFAVCHGLTSLDLSLFDTSNVLDMRAMFFHCKNLTNVNCRSFNTSKVTNMEEMFGCCEKLKNLDLSSFDTSLVTDMSWMFFDCRNLQNLSIDHFDTSKVSTLEFLFSECYELTSLNLSNFDISRCNEFTYMFQGCLELKTIYSEKWDLPSNADTHDMFLRCIRLTGVSQDGLKTTYNEYKVDGSMATPDGGYFTDPALAPKSEIEVTENSIISAVREYTSDDLYAQFQDISDSDLSMESKFHAWNSLFNSYGLANPREGIKYLSKTNDKRHAYLGLTTNDMYCASLWKHDLNETAKGLYMRPTLYLAGLVYNGEINEYLDVTHLVDTEYPGIKKYKDMLYDFMDFEGSKIEVQSYIKDVSDILKNSTKVGKNDADRIIDKLNKCSTTAELKQALSSSDALGVFTKMEDDKGKLVFTLNEDCGFGKFAKASGYATKAIGFADIAINTVFDWIELDAKLEVYENFRSFLTEISQNRTKIPFDLAYAAQLVLNEMDAGYGIQLRNTCLTIIDKITFGGDNISDLLLQEVLGETGATSLGSYLAVINVTAFFVNHIFADVGEMVTKASFTEGYAFLCDLYSAKLEAAKKAFQQAPTEENAWAFYYVYNMLWSLRVKGEESYLAMTKVDGLAALFSDFGYSAKKEVVNDTLNSLNKWKFTYDKAKPVTDYAQYASKLVIKCPVNVEVYTPDGTQIAVLNDGEESDVTNDYGRFAVTRDSYTEDYAKVLCFNSNLDYDIRIRAVENCIVSFDFSTESELTKQVNNLSLSKDDEIVFTTDSLLTGDPIPVVNENGETIQVITPIEDDNSITKVVTDIVLNKEQVVLELGQEQLLTASVIPANTSDQTLYWYAVDPSIASVKNGNITAISPGTTKVIVGSVDNTEIYKTISVEVKESLLDFYTATFHSNGGTSIPDQSIAPSENSKFDQPETPVKEHFLFEGWFVNPDFQNEYDFDSIVTSDIELFAKWTPETYTIAFHANGGSSIPDQMVTYSEEAFVARPSDPSRNGYIFNGWYCDEDLQTPYDFDALVDRNIDLYAGWDVDTTLLQMLFNSIDQENVQTEFAEENKQLLFDSLKQAEAVLQNPETREIVEQTIRDLHQAWLTVRYTPSCVKLNFY